jgi:hypothetical protein
MPDLPEKAIKKIVPLVRLLASDKAGEITAAVRALRRVLEGAGADLHTLDRIENRGTAKLLSDDEMLEIFNAGFAQGRSRGLEEAKRDVEFYAVGDEGDPDWRAMVRFCWERRARLRVRDRQFIESLAHQIRIRKPTELQRPWLIDLFRRLGGRL